MVKGCGKKMENGDEAWFLSRWDDEASYKKPLKDEVYYSVDFSACGVEYPCHDECCPRPYCRDCIVKLGYIW